MSKTRLAIGARGRRPQRADGRALHGFTLIELLVVVAIIALLVAILLPALQQAREEGKNAVCLSNAKQLGLLMIMYTSYYNEYFPPYGIDAAIPTWPDLFLDIGYLSLELRIYECPTLGSDVYTSGLSHYGYNYYHIGGTVRYPYSHLPMLFLTPAKITEIAKPSQTYLLMDAYDRLSDPPEGCYVVTDDAASRWDPHVRHRDSSGLNMTWVDGHTNSMYFADPELPYVELGDGSLLELGDPDNRWDRY